MGKFQDITGQRFGRWTVLEKAIRKGSLYYVKCQCECGTIKLVRKTDLLNGSSMTCGCWLSRSKAIRNARDEIGKKYNRLTILSLVQKKIDNSRGLIAICKCDCGKYSETKLTSIRSGHTKSCGCLAENNLCGRGNYKGGISKHPLYRKLGNMKGRCYNIKNNRYKNYGAKGITIYEEWLKDARPFVKWGEENGWKLGLSIDRRDPQGNYEPNNCQFITISENSIKANKDRKNARSKP